jgi:ShK domain-like
MLSITWVALLLFPAIVLSNQSCDLDGICKDSCEDQTSECESWAKEGLCRTNRDYMIRVCPRACNSCGTGSQEEDFGIEQTIDIQHEAGINQAIDDMKTYFRNVRQDSRTTARQHELFDNCKLKHELCTFWKVIGECDKVRIFFSQGTYLLFWSRINAFFNCRIQII